MTQLNRGLKAAVDQKYHRNSRAGGMIKTTSAFRPSPWVLVLVHAHHSYGTGAQLLRSREMMHLGAILEAV
jgi:hypothetical protein